MNASSTDQARHADALRAAMMCVWVNLATFKVGRKFKAGGRLVELRFLGRETTGGQSPTLYATDQNSYIMQGWIVTDANILAMFELAEDETLVEVYDRLMNHLAEDGLCGEVTREVDPIVHVRENGQYILRGKRVTDPKALAQMGMPDHETAIEVPKSVMARLIKGC